MSIGGDKGREETSEKNREEENQGRKRGKARGGGPAGAGQEALVSPATVWAVGGRRVLAFLGGGGGAAQSEGDRSGDPKESKGGRGALAVLLETDQSSSPRPLGAQAGVEVWILDGRTEDRTGRGTMPALTDQAEAVEPARGL